MSILYTYLSVYCYLWYWECLAGMNYLPHACTSLDTTFILCYCFSGLLNSFQWMHNFPPSIVFWLSDLQMHAACSYWGLLPPPSPNRIISPHIDSVKFCGDVISGLSLLSPSVMRLEHQSTNSKWISILLPPRSLYIIRWGHNTPLHASLISRPS